MFVMVTSSSLSWTPFLFHTTVGSASVKAIQENSCEDPTTATVVLGDSIIPERNIVTSIILPTQLRVIHFQYLVHQLEMYNYELKPTLQKLIT